MYMKKSSHAAFYGINAWIRKCAKMDGRLDDQEKKRMNYVKQFKEPLDEIGILLQSLPKLDHLSLSLTAGRFNIGFEEYMLEKILERRNVNNANCFYVSTLSGATLDNQNLGSSLLLRRFECMLKSPPDNKEESHLPSEMDAMYWVSKFQSLFFFFTLKQKSWYRILSEGTNI